VDRNEVSLEAAGATTCDEGVCGTNARPACAWNSENVDARVTAEKNLEITPLS